MFVKLFNGWQSDSGHQLKGDLQMLYVKTDTYDITADIYVYVSALLLNISF